MLLTLLRISLWNSNCIIYHLYYCFFYILIILWRPNGKTFIVPPQDVLIPTPTKGEIVTFSYESYARRDLPVNPRIFRIRTDVSWDDVIRNLSNEKKFLNGTFSSQNNMKNNNNKRKEKKYNQLNYYLKIII